MTLLLSKTTYYRPFYFTLACVKTHKCKSLPLKVRAFSTNRSHCTKFHSDQKPYFITTPIFYVNSAPHVGHLYTAVLSDVISRWKKLKHQNVIFSTGTDEHGLKIQQAAEQQNKSPQQHCDDVSGHFKRLFSAGDVEYSDFIRTTDEKHVQAVQHFWSRLASRGHIHRGAYEGWYSTADETFVPPDQVVTVTTDSGESVQVFSESGQPVEWIKEDNYMFPLHRMTDDLTHWLRGDVIQPAKFATEIYKYISEGLPDLSVSRSRSRLHWGIPVPGDDSQTIYVWLDALVNYLTVAGYPGPDQSLCWPADCHVVGKDILKFHAVYWPAFLIAAGLEPPRKVLCHSHWMVDGSKMSKSRGNVVDPFTAMDQFSCDGVRYFLMREGVLHSDGNFQSDRVTHVLNSELANTYGNLLSRCVGTKVNPRQRFPCADEAVMRQRCRPEDADMWDQLRSLPDIVDAHYDNFEVSKAVDAVMTQLRSTNNFMEFHKPWQLAKNPDEHDWLSMVLHVTMETLRVTSILLLPVMPKMSAKVLDKLQIDQTKRDFTSAKEKFQGDLDLSKSLGGLVFPRLRSQ